MNLLEPDWEAVKHLENGLALLRDKGWGKGAFHNAATGKCCALGALGAPFDPKQSPAAIGYLAYAIRNRKGAHPHYPPDFTDHMIVVSFNDGHRRKFAEVEAMFLRAIALAKGEGVQQGTSDVLDS